MHLSPCQFPKRIYNEFLGEYMHVPCGTCPSCRLSRQYKWVQRLNQESKCHQYSIFFTLTYSEDFVPKLRYTGSDILEPENFPYYIELEEQLDDKSWKLLDTDNCRVLSVRDVQLFVKRLRSNIKYTYENETNKKDTPTFRYYIVGEYGETTFRPHYHGILWFDSRWLADNFNVLFNKAWQKRAGNGFVSIGRTDWSFVKDSAASYVAQYLNSNYNLPKVLTSVKIRPFAISSRRPPIGSLFQSEPQILEIFHKGLTKISVPSQDGRPSTTTPLLSSFKNRLFPKCLRYSLLSSDVRVRVYRLAERFSPSEDFESYEEWLDYLKREVNYGDEIFQIPEYLKKITFNGSDMRPLVRALQISRRVIEQSRIFGCSVDYYVSRIELFYNNLELTNLANWYQFVEEYTKLHPYLNTLCYDLEFIQILYHSPSRINKHVLSYYGLENLSVKDWTELTYTSTFDYRSMVQNSAKILKETSKTKKKNDYLIAHPELLMFKNF